MPHALRHGTIGSTICAALLCLSLQVRAQTEPPIAAAADLKFALTEVAERFHSETSRAVKLSFGSSGNFATQLEQGAPFQLFFSADESFVQKLAAKGAGDGEAEIQHANAL